MTTFINNDGEQVDIVQNADGSYTVDGENGGSTTYGENVAANIEHDWNLEGTGFSLDMVDPAPVFDGSDTGGGDTGGGDTGGGDTGGGDTGGGDAGGG